MKKIKLDLSNLAVESFETGKDAFPRGTVQGQGASNERCNSDRSCADTCYFFSCNPSDCDRCTDPSEFGSCNYCMSNDPCVWTAGGSTCLVECQG